MERIALNEHIGNGLAELGNLAVVTAEPSKETPATVTITNTITDGKETTEVVRTEPAKVEAPATEQEINEVRRALDARCRALACLPSQVQEKEFAKLAKGNGGFIEGVETIDSLIALLATCEKVGFRFHNDRSGVTSYEVILPEGMRSCPEWTLIEVLQKAGHIAKVKVGYSEALQRVYFNAPEIPVGDFTCDRATFIVKDGKLLSWHAGFDLRLYERQWLKRGDKVVAAKHWVHIGSEFVPQPRKHYENRRQGGFRNNNRRPQPAPQQAPATTSGNEPVAK